MADSSPNLLDVRPGDDKAVNEVEELFLAYRETRDPAIRERIILVHVGLADRLAMRFRGNHGVASEDLVQAARVGLVAAVDRYDIDRSNHFTPDRDRRPPRRLRGAGGRGP